MALACLSRAVITCRDRDTLADSPIQSKLNATPAVLVSVCSSNLNATSRTSYRTHTTYLSLKRLEKDNNLHILTFSKSCVCHPERKHCCKAYNEGTTAAAFRESAAKMSLIRSLNILACIAIGCPTRSRSPVLVTVTSEANLCLTSSVGSVSHSNACSTGIENKGPMVVDEYKHESSCMYRVKSLLYECVRHIKLTRFLGEVSVFRKLEIWVKSERVINAA